MIKVSEEELEGLEFVRDSGETNMFDRNQVQRIAMQERFYDTVTWLEENPLKYGRGVVEGFES